MLLFSLCLQSPKVSKTSEFRPRTLESKDYLRPVNPKLSRILILAAIALTSCKRNSTEGFSVFRYNESAGIQSLDPLASSRVENIWGIAQVFNSLLETDTMLNPQPCLALRWSCDSSRTLWQFKLRNDVFFHDDACFPGSKGRRMTATDVAFSLQRLAAEDSPGQWVMQAVKRDQNGRLIINVIGEDSLQIFLSKPFSPFLSLLANPYCSVVPHEAIEKYGEQFGQHPVGTGPYKMAFWAEGEKLVLRKTDNYFQSYPKRPDAIAISFLKDRQAAFLEFMRGKFDFISGIDGSFKDEILDEEGKLKASYSEKIRMVRRPYLKTDYLGFRLDILPPAYRDKRVRQAMSHAIRREAMIKYLRRGIGIPAVNGFLPQGSKGFHSDFQSRQEDRGKVQKLLTEAGFPHGKGLPEISLLTSAANQELAEFLQHDWAEAGIPVKVEIAPSAVNAERTGKGQAMLFRKSWVADYSDDENFYLLFVGSNTAPAGPNYSGIQDERIDKLYSLALGENEPQKRKEIYLSIEKILDEEMPVIPLYYDEAVFFVHRNVQGLKGNPMNLPVLKLVTKPNE
jgi:oligopeptide transport system substrate-binding protein